jgi:hypothetical protein
MLPPSFIKGGERDLRKAKGADFHRGQKRFARRR